MWFGSGGFDPRSGFDPRGGSYDGEVIDVDAEPEDESRKGARGSDAITRLDLRGTHLTSVGIRHMPKLSRVLLPECCKNLNLFCCGKLSVVHPGKGEQLELSVNRPTRSIEHISGLARLRHLRVSSEEPFDCEELSCFPKLEHVVLDRVPRLISVELLAQLTRLRVVNSPAVVSSVSRPPFR